MSARSDKGHRNRKDSASAEHFKKLRKEQNAARPKQSVIVTVVYDKDGTRNEIYTRVRD